MAPFSRGGGRLCPMVTRTNDRGPVSVPARRSAQEGWVPIAPASYSLSGGRGTAAAADRTFPLVLNEERVADILGVTVKTLRNWRAAQKGPVARRASGRLVVYLLEDVEAWVRRLAPCGQSVPEPRRRGRPRKALHPA